MSYSVITSGICREQSLSHARVFKYMIGGSPLVRISVTTSSVCLLRFIWVELHMRRPNKDRYRLDNLLEKKAKEGVKIYIIL